ncbi:MAG: nucleotide exchange factor GrpE [Paludibacteraceae bacterium]|nr:nucleotide exchange factor GrpE [Paludibacteraceae bacterium]
MKEDKEAKQKDINESSNATDVEQETAKQEAETQETVNEEDTMEQQISELNEKIADLNDKNLRLMAEFDNYRKRTIREKAGLIKTAGEQIFKEMLPIIDDFERAVESIKTASDTEAITEGISLMYNKFVRFLEKNDVKAIETDGVAYDADIHEAIATVPAPSEEQKNTIVDCTQKGYVLGDKIIRHPKVVVGQ